MKTTIKDDRTEEQKSTHYWGVIARDKAMSYWGMASNGISRVAWACKSYEDACKAFDWVKSRSEMKNVQIHDLRKHNPKGKDSQFHVYVCGESHPALQ